MTKELERRVAWKALRRAQKHIHVARRTTGDKAKKELALYFYFTDLYFAHRHALDE